MGTAFPANPLVLPDGTPVERIVLAHKSGIRVAVITYGAAIQALETPDRHGVFDDIVLGHDDPGGYLRERNFFGATIGRFGNRIANARFSLDGVEYDLSRNDGANSLHGGTHGFDTKNWSIEAVGVDPEPFVLLHLHSPDDEGGFPGNLDVWLRYQVGADRTLTLEFEAKSDRATFVNLTHHGFFNLGGLTAADVLDHVLLIDADRFLPVNDALIPLGPSEAVEGTPFDFREPRPIGAGISGGSSTVATGPRMRSQLLPK